jgi:hypothetical protein
LKFPDAKIVCVRLCNEKNAHRRWQLGRTEIAAGTVKPVPAIVGWCGLADQPSQDRAAPREQIAMGKPVM